MDKKGIGYGDDFVINMVNNKGNIKGNIPDKIKAANTQPIKTYMGMIEGKVPMEVNESMAKISESKKIVNARQETKRIMKNKAKRDERKRRWKAIGLTGLLAITAGVGYAIHEFPEFREKSFNEALSEAKTSIGESVNINPEKIKMYNHSTLLSSDSAKTEYELVLDTDIYSYTSYTDGTETRLEKDEIKNEDVINAISCISHAQNGNIFEVMKARKLISKIKNGEINLDVSEAVATRNSEKILQKQQYDKDYERD